MSAAAIALEAVKGKGRRRSPASRPLSMDESVREAMRDVYRDLRIKDAIGLGLDESSASDGRRVGAALSIRFVPAKSKDFPSNTACWYYDEKEKRAHICLGEAIGQHVTKQQHRFGEYAGLFTYHEAAHDRWTTRNLRAAITTAEACGVTKNELNLFEDARIEELARRHWQVKFGWAEFEKDRRPDAGQPLTLVDQFIWLNGDRDAARSRSLAAGCDGPLVDRVRDFYERTVNAPSTEAVIPIIVEFKKAFPAPPPPPAGASPQPGSAGSGAPRLQDLEMAASMADSPGTAAAVVGGSKIAAGKPADGEASGPQSERQPLLTVSEFTTGPIISPRMGPSFYEPPDLRVQRCVSMLLPVFTGRDRREFSVAPTRRFEPRRYLDEREDSWSHRVPDGFIGKRNVHLFFDCSGSMRGSPNHAGKDLIDVMNALQQRGKIDGHVTLHQVRGHEAKFHTMKLPIPKTELANIPANGDAEGIKFALEGCRRLVSQADLVVLYTDGNIVDAPIDRRVWHSQGIFTHGLYVGPAHSAARLGEFTDYPLRASSSEELVQLFAGQVLKTGFAKRRI